MKYLTEKLVSMGSLVFIAALIGTAVITSAQSWSSPSETPPGGNALGPINTSTEHQVKIGGISVGSLISTGGICFGEDCKSSWSEVSEGGVPSGAVMAFNLSSCPSGWSAFTAARGRAVVGSGSGSGLTTRSLGSTFGEENHTLTVSEIPAHSHRLYVDNSSRPSGYDRNASFGTDGQNVAVAGEDYGQAYISTNTDSRRLIENTGGGNAHNNMQPSIALLYCQKN